ncbi:MAG: hypothetical protein AAFN74_26145, partial [Myxococcota bacterium]
MRVSYMACAGLTALFAASCGDDQTIDSADRSQTEFPEGFEACSALESDCDTRCSGDFENVTCTGTISGDYDNITVPSGSTCTLQDVRMTGDLLVDEDATADVGANVFVCGNLQT